MFFISLPFKNNRLALMYVASYVCGLLWHDSTDLLWTYYGFPMDLLSLTDSTDLLWTYCGLTVDLLSLTHWNEQVLTVDFGAYCGLIWNLLVDLL